MKRSVLASVLGSLVFGMTAVGDTTIAPVQNIFPSAYSNVLMRHYVSQKEETSTPSMQMRYYLGSTFFEDKLDVALVFGFVKEAQTDYVKDRGTRIEGLLDIYENELMKVQAWTEIKTPADGYGTNADIGLYVPVSYTFSTPVGALTPVVSAEAITYVGSRSQKVPVRGTISDTAAKNFGLAKSDKGVYETESKALKMTREFAYGATFTPNAVDGLSVMAKSYHTTKYNPIMEETAEGRLELKKEGQFASYSTDYTRTNRLMVRYDFSENFYVANDLYLYDRYNSNDVRHYMNRISVGATLF